MAERHDIILKLKNEINDMEQQLKQKDTHIQFKDEIIKELRSRRRGYLKVRRSFILIFIETNFWIFRNFYFIPNNVAIYFLELYLLFILSVRTIWEKLNSIQLTKWSI